MRIYIPDQLKNNEFRFCPLKKGTKISSNSHTKINYKFNDPNLLNLLDLNENYGVMGGYDNLVIIDVDSDTILKKLNTLNLPPTFTILSALNRKPHFYYKTEDRKSTKRFEGLDIIGFGNYAVGCNSIITWDKKKGIIDPPQVYTISKNLPIAFLSKEKYEEILKIGNKNPRQFTPKKKVEKPIYNKEPKREYVKRENSHYLLKEFFFNKPTDFLIEDVIGEGTRYTYDLKLSSLDSIYKDKTIDLCKAEQLKFLKKVLPTLIITLISEEKGYINQRTGKPALEWRIKNVRKK